MEGSLFVYELRMSCVGNCAAASSVSTFPALFTFHCVMASSATFSCCIFNGDISSIQAGSQYTFNRKRLSP